jgi:hypothetical protein
LILLKVKIDQNRYTDSTVTSWGFFLQFRAFSPSEFGFFFAGFEKSMRDIRMALLQPISSTPDDIFDQRRTGELISRPQPDVSMLKIRSVTFGWSFFTTHSWQGLSSSVSHDPKLTLFMPYTLSGFGNTVRLTRRITGYPAQNRAATLHKPRTAKAAKRQRPESSRYRNG